MPVTITIPGRDLFDPNTKRFITVKTQKLVLEHSLISISKWEAKWHKPYLSRDEKTNEENIDYIRCMCLTQNVDPNVFYALDPKSAKIISDYISDPMTGTTFHNQDKRHGREIITNELIYFWMTQFGIPFDPCEKWHLNHLMTLINVAAIKNQPSKKMGKKDILSRNAALNAQRRARFGSLG